MSTSSYTATATVIVPAPITQSLQSVSTSLKQVPQKISQNKDAPSRPAEPVVPSPGRYRHPRMTEVARRRAASSFTSRNVQTVALNVLALLITWLSNDHVYPALTTLIHQTRLDEMSLSASMVVGLARLFFLANIYFALRPVLPYFSQQDALEDIPLTPSQRALMGLPQSQSNTPRSQPQAGAATANYVTPPRYRKSSPSPFAGTPQSGGTGNRSISANYSASPMSTSRFAQAFSPTPQQVSATPSARPSGSPFSPSSPLFSKRFLSPAARNEALPNAEFTESTRSLLDGATSTSSFQGSLRRSQSMRERGRPQAYESGTPSPSTREKSRVNVQPGLNYKWLYEKGAKVGRNGNIEY